MENKVKLVSSDNKMFQVEEYVVYKSQILKEMIENTRVDRAITLPNVHSKILALVIKYCSYHVETEKDFDENPTFSPEQIKQWDAEFINLEFVTLAGLITAAHYLDIGSLLELGCQAVADMIKGKTAEEIRTIFNIENNLTP